MKTDMNERLMDSFKALVCKTSIEKITIKDITDGAGVIRPTFYNHFQDKYELLEAIIRNELLKPMMPLIENGMITAATTLILTNILKDKEFYQNASRLEGQNSFEEITRNCIKDLLTEYITEVTGNEKAESGTKLLRTFLTAENLAEYYATSMNFVVSRWLREGCVVPPADMAEIYDFLLSHSMNDMIQAMK